MSVVKQLLFLLVVAAALAGCRSGGSQSTAQSSGDSYDKPVIYRPQPGDRGC